jgi:hypothetical protein
MKRSICLFAVVLTTHFGLIAQHGFKEGYILKTPIDTLFGFIENRSYKYNSLNCNFKTSVADPATHYSPSEIFGYRFTNGKYYISKKIGNENYFLEFLLKGKLNVYFKQTTDGKNQFYIDNDVLPIVKLQPLHETYSGDYRNYRINEFSGHNLVLAYYTSDYPPLRETAINMRGLEAKSLIQFAENYHNSVCKDQSCEIYKKKKPSAYEIELNFGFIHIFEEPGHAFPSETSLSSGFIFGIMIPKTSESVYVGTGANLMTRYPDRISIEMYNETISYKAEYKTKVQIPFTIYYNNHRSGLSPIYGASTNILRLTNFKGHAGLNYQYRSIGIKLYGECEMFRTEMNTFIKSAGLKLGISYFITSNS